MTLGWTIDCYVRTPASSTEIFTGYVGQTVRLSAIVKRYVARPIPIPVKDVEVRFYKNNVYFATAKTRSDGWADGDNTLTSADVGSVKWKAEAWVSGKSVASRVSDAPFDVYAEVPTVPPEEGVAPPAELKCFIVTACFDSLKVAQVQRLRTFRDSCLPKHVTRLYYRVSPPIARFLRKHETLRVSARNLIERLLLSPIRVYNKPTIKLREDPKNPTRLEILGENVLDAFIDGCIAGLMTGWLVNPDIGWKVALGVGLLKFFIRLKELRGK